MATAEIFELQRAGRFREAGEMMAALDRQQDRPQQAMPGDDIAADIETHIHDQTPRADCPEPGIYEDVPFEDYLSWNAVSNSRINQARKSLAHFKANTSKPPSKELNFGSLVHTGRLEPLSIAQRYAVMPAFELDEDNKTVEGERSFSKATTYYKSKCEHFEIANRDKEIIEQAAYDKMLGCVAGIAANDRANRWLNSAGPVEVSIVWDDPKTGLRCKARIDKATSDWMILTDLKTTRDAMNFEKSIANFGYHRQAAHYSGGVEVLTCVKPMFGIVAIETEQPYLARTAPVGAESIAVGRREVDETLAAIREAYETDNWPGYDDPDEWGLPGWYAKDQEQSIGDWLKSEGSTTGE